MTQGDNGADRSSLGRRAGISLVVFLVAIGFLLLLEHRAHIPGDYYLLGFILLFCGGMHFFMHGGHGGHGGGSQTAPAKSGPHSSHGQYADTQPGSVPPRPEIGERPANDREVG